ncbi:MAG: hypothetical protein JW772_03185 [Candidatus Diapherotrites archaeon]|nr:hypothetical protein [Candidatus Diapherotrites archaeon]
MNSRAQSGLEYLMTYGWGLIIIVTVAAVLFFLFAPPEDQFTCVSNDILTMPLESYNFPYSPAKYANCAARSPREHCEYWGAALYGADKAGEMNIINGTGGPILIKDIRLPELITTTGQAGGCTYNEEFAIERWWGPKLVNGVDVTTINPSNPLKVSGGEKIHIEGIFIGYHSLPGCNNTNIAGNNFQKERSMVITYNDQFGYEKSVTITCYGIPPKP